MEKSSNKNFGIIMAIFFVIIALWPKFYGNEIRIWSIIVSFIFIFFALLVPRYLKTLNILWTKFGFLLGKIIAPIIMMIIFFLIVTPIGLIMRLSQKDILKLKKDKNSSTYWINRTDEKSNMKNQF
tara:strand:- start:187 stop:564 length:378 start_codon:yes stop_codon:yes gene_type:complete